MHVFKQLQISPILPVVSRRYKKYNNVYPPLIAIATDWLME